MEARHGRTVGGPITGAGGLVRSYRRMGGGCRGGEKRGILFPYDQRRANGTAVCNECPRAPQIAAPCGDRNKIREKYRLRGASIRITASDLASIMRRVPRLTPAAVETIVQSSRRPDAKLSSIHVNGWFGNRKLARTRT